MDTAAYGYGVVWNVPANRLEETTMGLPPGQRAVQGFPRFGVDLDHAPPEPPEGMTIEIVGELARRVSLAPADLTGLPRREVVADLHCVAGWSAVGLRWEGVAFADLHRLLIEPALRPTARVRYVVFVGLDGFRSIVALEDALADNVLVADRLNGEPLTAEHGAPVRLVSPDQYGFVSTKHLCRIELYRSEPVGFYHPTRSIQRALRTVRAHRRARVWREERHRYFPWWLVRPVYRRLVKLPAPLKE
jgi:DMSO/TMAO reductase YedYZ molybdopterin-dependent catalytic subunit